MAVAAIVMPMELAMVVRVIAMTMEIIMVRWLIAKNLSEGKMVDCRRRLEMVGSWKLVEMKEKAKGKAKRETGEGSESEMMGRQRRRMKKRVVKQEKLRTFGHKRSGKKLQSVKSLLEL